MATSEAVRPYKTLEDVIGGTPLVRLQRLPGEAIAARGNVVLGKLEGNNPAGSVKDRPAIGMIRGAEERGEIRPGDTLIEATSGNTGIALAMAAAIRGYRMVLIMPEDLSIERAQTMKAFGAELILTPVSYTHLDVYKRQPSMRRMSRSFISLKTWSVNLPPGRWRRCSSMAGGLPSSCGALAML